MAHRKTGSPSAGHWKNGTGRGGSGCSATRVFKMTYIERFPLTFFEITVLDSLILNISLFNSIFITQIVNYSREQQCPKCGGLLGKSPKFGYMIQYMKMLTYLH